MSESSLVPERQLVFSPSLAATIGLEETILLQHLQELFHHRSPQHRDGYAWLSVEFDLLERALPFWRPTDLHRICRSLVDKGVILMDARRPEIGERLIFALNERTGTHMEPRAPAAPRPSHAPPAPRPSAGQLADNWSPSEDVLQLLALNHTIPRKFALDQLEDFIFYWRERAEISHAWENKFRQHVIGNWRRHQQAEAESRISGKPAKLDRNWMPSADAMEILQRSEVDNNFIEEAIPEFLLYWRERGAAPKELNSKFIQHVKIQWAKYVSSVEHSTEPRRIPEQWSPSSDVFDILRMSHIDADFARDLVPEFILYWRDTNQVNTSWGTKFIQHAKYHWAKRHQLEQRTNREQSHGGQQAPHSTGRTRDRSLQDDLTDTSWAK